MAKAVRSIKTKVKEIYAVNLKLKTGTGSRKISMSWMGVDIKPDLAAKLEIYVDKARVNILPIGIRNELSNFRQNVRNSIILKFVPMGFAGKAMTKTMLDKALIEFADFTTEFDTFVDTIDKNFSNYEKDFYSIFEEALKGSSEKDAIMKELKLMMPSKMDIMSSLELEFEHMPIPITENFEKRFVGRALGIAYKRAYLIERLTFKNNKVDMRSLSGIERDIEMFKELEVINIAEVAEITKDLKDLLALNGSGKSTNKKAKLIMTKINKHAMKNGTYDLVSI